MKSIEKSAKKINHEISKWSQQNDKLIVAIDGYAGSGKTLIANRIAEINTSCLVIHLDDFIKHWQIRKSMIYKAKDPSKVFEYNWYRYDAIERLVKKFLSVSNGFVCLKVYDFNMNKFITSRPFDLSKKVLLIEGIFVLHPKHKRNNLWQKKIFLNVNFEKSETRRTSLEKQKLGTLYLPEDHPNSYFSYFRTAYLRYLSQYKPWQYADILINVDSN